MAVFKDLIVPGRACLLRESCTVISYIGVLLVRLGERFLGFQSQAFANELVHRHIQVQKFVMFGLKGRPQIIFVEFEIG